MVNRRISSDIKTRALQLWQAGWSVEDVCYTLHVSPSSLYRWQNTLDDFESVIKPHSSLHGRHRIIDLAALTAIKKLYYHNPSIMVGELQWHLAIEHDIPISISALQATLDRAGLTRKILQKIASERNEASRAAFRACLRDPDNFSGTAMEFVTIDESSKDERSLARCYGRSPVGQRAELSNPFVRGDRYSLVAAMSTQGYIATRIVPGSVNAFEFFDFIVEDVVSARGLYCLMSNIIFSS